MSRKQDNQKVFFTLVKPDESDPYDICVTSMCSMSIVIMGEDRHACVNTPEGKLFVQRGSRRNYGKFTKVIESACPGRCKFDYKVK